MDHKVPSFHLPLAPTHAKPLLLSPSQISQFILFKEPILPHHNHPSA